MEGRVVCTLCGYESKDLEEGLAHCEREHPIEAAAQ